MCARSSLNANVVKVLLQWKSTSVHTSWTYSTYHLELALGTFMPHFVSACLVRHTSLENISKFVFENSRFQIAEAFQSLLCDGRSATVVNKSRTCWATMVISSLFLRYFLHWYGHRGLGCGKMMKFTLKIFNIFGDVYTRDGAISLCQRDARAQIVVSHNHSTQVSDPFRSPPPCSPNDMIVTDICQYIMYPT